MRVHRILFVLVASALIAPVAAADEAWEQQRSAEGGEWTPVDPSDMDNGVAYQPLHRRLPKFYLTTNLVYDGGATLIRDPYGASCGKRMKSQMGAEINFDFRFWYLFIGTHMAGHGEESETLEEYAVRGGFLIPIGERFAFVAAAWMGVASWTGTGPQTDLLREAGLSLIDDDGFLLGASFGARFLITSWLGLTADLSGSTIFYEGQGVGYSDSTAVHLRRWTASSGLVFAW